MKFKYKTVNFIKRYKFLKSVVRYLFFKNINVLRNNRIILVKTDGQRVYNHKFKNVQCCFLGKNNTVEICEPYNIQSLKVFTRKSGNIFKLGANSRIRNLKADLGENTRIEIGNNFSSQNVTLTTYYAKNTDIKVGSDCMFSYEVFIRASDTHAIYDINTNELINPTKDVNIGNHVWICAKTLLLKGAKIPDCCVVGAGSIVSKAFSVPNCIIAGVPAKVVKENINWDRAIIDDWLSKKAENATMGK